jgi:hypothetical protein
MSGGRPSLKTPEVVEEICERLASGETLSSICQDERMPAFSTIYAWEKSDPEFLNVSLRAREVGTHALADQCIEIADDSSRDWLETEDESQRHVFNSEHVQRAKLRIDTRLRLIGKWNAKKYGEKAQVDHTSSDGTMTPPSAIQLVGPSDHGQG